MNAVRSSIIFDSGYAPEILIFRFTRWPALKEQQALLAALVAEKHLAPHSTGVLDITALSTGDLPDPDSLASALAQAADRNSVLKRVACVVASPEQARFVETLRRMAPQPGKIGVFLTQADALQWLLQKMD